MGLTVNTEGKTDSGDRFRDSFHEGGRVQLEWLLPVFARTWRVEAAELPGLRRQIVAAMNDQRLLADVSRTMGDDVEMIVDRLRRVDAVAREAQRASCALMWG